MAKITPAQRAEQAKDWTSIRVLWNCRRKVMYKDKVLSSIRVPVSMMTNKLDIQEIARPYS